MVQGLHLKMIPLWQLYRVDKHVIAVAGRLEGGVWTEMYYLAEIIAMSCR